MQRTTFLRVVLVLALMCALCLVFAAVTGNLFTYEGGDNTKQSKAQLGCKSLETAIEAYIENKDNTKHAFPHTLENLVEPPFGGPSFLRNGRADLIDPWGKPYEMEPIRRTNGTEFILVKTAAPDGTFITQFGIAPHATPRPE